MIVAVPAGSSQASPELFFAVGEWYRDFGQISDDEVRRLLAESRRGLSDRRAGQAAIAAMAGVFVSWPSRCIRY